MYAAAPTPNGRVGVGVEARAGLVSETEPEDERCGCAGRATGVWGCGATTGVGAGGGDAGCRSWLCP